MNQRLLGQRFSRIAPLLLSFIVLLLSLLGGGEAAHAHRPHDVVSQVVVSPTYNQDQTVYILVRNSLFRSQDGGETWQRISNGLDNRNNLDALVTSAANGRILYTAASGDGIYRSEDGGDSWRWVSASLEDREIAWIMAAPADANLVFAQTEADRLYRTQDGGASWQRVRDGIAATTLAIAPDNSNILILGGPEGQLWRSEDQGETWTPIATLQDVGPIQQIAIAADFATNPTFAVATAAAGIYRTLDAGQSFEALNEGLSDERVQDIQMLADGTLLASTWQDGYWQWRPDTEDWVNLAAGLERDPQADEMKVPHFQDLEASSTFAQDGTLFLGGFDGLFRSTDGGQQWQQLETLSLGTVIDMAVSPTFAEDRTIALATYVGELYLSQDAGDTWQAVNQDLYLPRFTRNFQPLDGKQDPRRFFDVELSPSYARDQTLFASILYTKVLRSGDGGSNWSVKQLDRSVRGVSLAPSPTFEQDQTVFSMNQKGLVYRSTDGGRSFEFLSEGMPQPGNDAPSTALSPRFSEDQTLYTTGEEGVYKSSDAGETWQLLTENTPLAEAGGLQLAISPEFTADQTLWVGTRDGLYRTQDGGETWSALASIADEGNPYIEAIAVSPNYGEDGTVMVSVRGQGLLKSTDGGDSFTRLSVDPGFTFARLNSVPSAGRPLQFSPNYAEDNTLFGFGAARTEIYRSTDGGETWEMLPVERKRVTTIGQPGPLATAGLFLDIHRGKISKLLGILAIALLGYGGLRYLGDRRWITFPLPEVQACPQTVVRQVPTWLKVTVMAVVALRLVLTLSGLGDKPYNADEVRGFYRMSGYTEAEVKQQAFQGQTLTVDQLQHFETPSADRDLGDAITALSGNPEHPPLYYLLGRFWMQIWRNPLSTRVLAVIFGVAALFAAYWLGIELFRSAWAGWLAAALISLSPYYALLSQGARQYSLWMLAILASSAALLRAIRLHQRSAWGVYGVIVIVGLYSHLFFLFTLAAQGIYGVLFTWRQQGRLRSLLMTLSVSLIAFLPWIWNVLSSLQQLNEKTQWVQSRHSSLIVIARASVKNLGNTFLDLNDSTRLENYADWLMVALVALALFCLWRANPVRRWIFLLLPIVITGAVLVVPDLLYGGGRSLQARYLVPALLSVELIVAYFLANSMRASKHRWERWSWSAVFMLLMGFGVASGVAMMQNPGWDYLDQGRTASVVNLDIAPLINQAEAPLVMSDATHSFLLALSYEVQDQAQFQLFQDTDPTQWSTLIDLDAALERYSDVYLYYPSSDFRSFFEDSYGATLEPVFEKQLYRISW